VKRVGQRLHWATFTQRIGDGGDSKAKVYLGAPELRRGGKRRNREVRRAKYEGFASEKWK